MLISCAFPPSPATVAHIELAERLGYHRAWCYDSPAVYSDPWMILALAAERTATIGLGPGVLVPHLRHPMVNAAAAATLEALAPGRVIVAVGSGFNATGALGRKPVPWAEVTAYAETLRSLLEGQEAMWDGQVIRMLHSPGWAPPRPLNTRIFLAASGPRGLQAARQFSDSVFLGPRPQGAGDFEHAAALITGTVFEEGEDFSSPRVMDAAGHNPAVFLHWLYEQGRDDVLAGVPGGLAWKASMDALPNRTRHLALHELNHIAPTERDWPFIGPELLARAAFTPDQLRERLCTFEQDGVTEVAYQPAGADVPRELASFLEAAKTL